MTEPDRRFLGGAGGVVLTDTREMRWTLACGWDGAVDLVVNVDRATLAAELRWLADRIEQGAQ